MVAQGFCERIGKDFYSTFSPMASLTSVRALFAIAVYHRLGCYHADIPNAFVRSKTETELYCSKTLQKSLERSLDKLHAQPSNPMSRFVKRFVKISAHTAPPGELSGSPEPW